MNKISALWNLFKKGEAVSNADAWTTGKITATVIGAAILAVVNVAQSFGYAVPIDADIANAIGGGVLAAGNVIVSIIASKGVGLPASGRNDPYPAIESRNN